METRIALTTSAPELTGMNDLFMGEGNPQTIPFLATFTQAVDSPHPESFLPQFIPNYSVTINWGDETGDDTSTGSWHILKQERTADGYIYTGQLRGSHTFLVADDYQVSVTLDDGINPAVTTVLNVAVYPMATSDDITVEEITEESTIPNPNDPGNPFVGFPEGDVYEISLSSTLSPSPTEYKVNWGDGSVTNVGGGGGLVQHVYTDNLFQSTYQSWVAAKNADGWHFVGGTNVNVIDILPEVSIDGVGGDLTGTVDEPFSIEFTTVDPGDDQATLWMIDWNYDENVGFNPEFPAGFIFDDVAGASHVYSAPGEYKVMAQMSDSDGNGAISNIITVVITADVPAPTANAGGPYSTFDDMPIVLNGSGAGGTGVLSYAWDLDADGIFGETGSAAGNGNEVGASPTFNPSGLAGQSIAITLRVTDEANVSSESTSTVQVKLAEVVSGSLVVVGNSEQSDNVTVTLSGGNIVVQNGSGAPQTFAPGSITSLEIRTGGGNDIVVIGAGINVPTTIDGGDGNDLLVGGSGRSVLIGGAGNDFLYGAAGNDVLLGGVGNDQLFGGGGNDAIVGGGGIDIIDGGAGRDLVAGGAGSDLLVGGGGDDILIGGTTVHDGNVAALDSIMGIWSGSGTFNARVAALTAAGVGLLRVGNISDDDSIDIVTTGAGSDLVFGDTNPFDGALDLIALQSAQDRLIAVN